MLLFDIPSPPRSGGEGQGEGTFESIFRLSRKDYMIKKVIFASLVMTLSLGLLSGCIVMMAPMMAAHLIWPAHHSSEQKESDQSTHHPEVSNLQPSPDDTLNQSAPFPAY